MGSQGSNGSFAETSAFFDFFNNPWHLSSKSSQPVVPALSQFSQFSLTGGNKTPLNDQLSLNALQDALRLPDVVTNMRRVVLGGLDLSGESVHLLSEEALRDDMCVTLGGRAAEAIVFNQV